MRLRLIKNGNDVFAIEIQSPDDSWTRCSRWFVLRAKAIAFAQNIFNLEQENILAQQITVVETYSGSN